MKVLSTEETVQWCGEHEIALSDSGLPEKSDATIKFMIPEDAENGSIWHLKPWGHFATRRFFWFGSMTGMYGRLVSACMSSTGLECPTEKLGG